MRLRLATRGSRLAWGQSSQVAAALRANGHAVDLIRVVTHGDVSTAALASLGGSGVFVGAVRAALLSGDADIAVHSFKDLPTAPTGGLMLAAVPRREDPADALCSASGAPLAELPRGARVGTGSPRRAAQLLAVRPDLEVVQIRGNVETRLGRIDDDLDAVVLAAAGLRRLGLADRISERLDPSAFWPAPAQGALAIECRSDAAADLLAALRTLDDPATRLAATAERAVLAGLEAGCAAPVGAYAVAEQDTLALSATVVSLDGTTRLTRTAAVPLQDGEPAAAGLGAQVATDLLADGAAELVELGAHSPGHLHGTRILLPQRSPSGLAEALSAAGATVTHAAFTAFEALPAEGLQQALATGPDWVIFTSATTLSVLAGEGFDFTMLDGFPIATVGPSTAAAARQFGLRVEREPATAGGSGLVEAFPTGTGRVLIPGAEQPSAQPASGLTAKGWSVVAVPVYRTVAVALENPTLSLWQSGGFDAFVVTAGSVARSAVASAGLPGPRVVALGTSAAATAREVGLVVASVAETPDAPGVVAALGRAFAEA